MRVIEAAWLQAVVVLPLFFHVLSFRVFEPEKTAVLRLLAIIAAAGLLVAAIATRERRMLATDRLRSVSCVAAAALVAATAMSTALSVDPWHSLLGSYHRQGGLITLIAQTILFAAVVLVVRTPSQIERLSTAVIVSSVVASTYAVVQRLGIDPLSWDAASWGGDPIARTPGTLGNPTFLAGYIAMAMFVTAARVSSRPLTTVALIVQAAGMWVAASRGALIAVAAGAAVFALVLAAAYHARRVAAAIALSVAAVAAFLVLLNIPGPLDSIRNAWPWHRFSHVLDATDETSRVRLLIWRAAHEAMMAGAPVETLGGVADRHHAARRLVGYGPETLNTMIARVYLPELGRLERPNAIADRAHNDLVDAMATGGSVSFALTLVLMASVLIAGCRAAGLGSRAEFVCTLAMGLVALGTASAALLAGLGWFIVPVMGTAMVAGFVTALAALGTLGKHDAARGPHTITVAALLAAVTAHVVDGQIGIATVAPRTLFWALSGFLVALAATGRNAVIADKAATPEDNSRWTAWFAGTAIVTLGFGFAPDMITLATAWHGALVLAAIAATVMFVAVVSDMLRWRQAAAVLGGSAGAVVAFVAVARWTVTGGDPADRDVVGTLATLGGPVTLYLAAVAAVVLTMARVQRERDGLRTIAVASLASAAALSLVLRPIRADVLVRGARQLEVRGYPLVAVPLYEAALRLMPHEGQYRVAIAAAAQVAAVLQPDHRAREALFERANSALEGDHTREFDLQRTFAAARLYHAWAATTEDASARVQRGAQANAYYQRLAVLSPTNPVYWNDWGALALDVFGNPRLARSRLQRSLVLDPSRADTSKLIAEADRRLQQAGS